MSPVAHPEVLSIDWLPPVLLARERELQDLVRRLDAPHPHAPAPWIVGVAGPSGAGSSTLARRAARETVDRMRASGDSPPARTLAVRTALLRGAHGVATALLQRFDDGFDGRGFPTAEILAGVLRRIRREGRPTVIVLDDIAVGGAELAPLLRAIGEPDRFLPEGESGLPPVWTVLAGSAEGLETAARGLEGRFAVRPFLELEPYSETALRSIVRDRFERACGRAPSSELVTRIVGRAIGDGLGARRAIDLLRRDVLGTRGRIDGDPPVRAAHLSIEPRVVRAIGAAIGGGAAPLSEIRRCEAALAARQGVRPLPTTTLWRRLVRLERAGYVRREIRTGGSGGTRSVLRLLSPIDEWVTAPGRSETLRGFASLVGGAPPLELSGGTPRERPPVGFPEG